MSSSKTDMPAKVDHKNEHENNPDIIDDSRAWRVFWRNANIRGYSFRPDGDYFSLLFLNSRKVFQALSWSSIHVEVWTDTALNIFEVMKSDGDVVSDRFKAAIINMKFPNRRVQKLATETYEASIIPSVFDNTHVRIPDAIDDYEHVLDALSKSLENTEAAYLFLYHIGHILVSISGGRKPRNFLILEGMPGTGKSTFWEALTKYITEYGYVTAQMPPLRAGFGWGECATAHNAYTDDSSPEEIMALMAFPAFLSFVSHNSTKSEEKGRAHVTHQQPTAAYTVLCNQIPHNIVNSPAGTLNRALMLRVATEMSSLVPMVPDIVGAAVSVYNSVWETMDANHVMRWIEENRSCTYYSMTNNIISEIVQQQYNIIRSVGIEAHELAYSSALLYYLMPFMSGFTTELSRPVLAQRIDALVKWYTQPGNSSSKPPQESLHNHILYKGVYVPTRYRLYQAVWEMVAKNQKYDTVDFSSREKANISRDLRAMFPSAQDI